jgi:hypothetical protein
MGARDFGDQLLGRLLDYAMQSIPTALGLGVSVADARQPRLVASVGVADALDRAQWEAGEGPTWEALRTGKTVVLPQPDEPEPLRLERWPRLFERVDSALVEKVQGVVVTPGEWGGDLPMVFSAYLDQPPQPRVAGEIDGHEALIANALAVVEYCAGEEMRAEQMLQMSQYRRVIEQAKGLIMSALAVDGVAAFAVLSRASQHFNVRLRSLAIALVEHVGGGQAEHPEDVESVVIPGEADRRVAAQVWLALSSGGPVRPSGLFLPDDPPVPGTAPIEL